MKKQHPVKQTAFDYLREYVDENFDVVIAESKQFKMTTEIDMEQHALDLLKHNRAIVLTIRQNSLLNGICIAYIYDSAVYLSTNVKLENIINAIDEAGFNMEAIEKIIKTSCTEHQQMIISAFEQRQIDKRIVADGIDTQSIIF